MEKFNYLNFNSIDELLLEVSDSSKFKYPRLYVYSNWRKSQLCKKEFYEALKSACCVWDFIKEGKKGKLGRLIEVTDDSIFINHELRFIFRHRGNCDSQYFNGRFLYGINGLINLKNHQLIDFAQSRINKELK